jgi:NAD-dependent deacetylase
MSLDAVVAAIARARTVTALTGAGVSAASGIPTFRGADGLWRHFHTETLATPEAFRRDPTEQLATCNLQLATCK